MSSDNRNILLAVVLSILILLGSQLFFDTRSGPAPQGQSGQDAAQNAQQAADPNAPPAPRMDEGGAAVPSVPGGADALEAAMGLSRAAALEKTPRIRINSPRLNGSISLVGGVIDDMTLTDYRETLEPDSPQIIVLSPKGAKGAYYAQHGWIQAAGGAPVELPGADTLWTADADVLTPRRPLTLSWTNAAGVTFEKVIELDDEYMFTVTQRVKNNSAATAAVHPYSLILRRGTPEVTPFIILHEGLYGVFNGTLEEVDYDDLQDEPGGELAYPTTGGWIGVTDKYWLAALIPDQKTAVDARFLHRTDTGGDRYQADFVAPAQLARPGGEAVSVSRLFTGAKELRLMDGYEETLGIGRFDLTIDFGWFYFLTKPLFYVLLWINSYAGNLGVAILLLTVLIKLAFFPLANKSYKSMSKMKKLQPDMLKLRERYGDDKMKLNQEMMALYKREGANPASGCLPIMVQIPVFFALYKVLFVTIEMRHAPFFGWVQDLSAPDPLSLFNLFGLIPWDPPQLLMVGPWALLMGGSMFLQQKLNPQPTDPIQAKIFLYMPLLFTFMLASFPAGLVIYWAWNNILSITQQWVIMKRMGVSAAN
ncbi:MAG: membrane protein insertase YidC [Rhodospirillales bacterium]